MGHNTRWIRHIALLTTLGGGLFAAGYLLASYTMAQAPKQMAGAVCLGRPGVSSLIDTLVAQHQSIARLEEQAKTLPQEGASHSPWPRMDALETICLALVEPMQHDCQSCVAAGGPVPAPGMPAPVAEPSLCPSAVSYWLAESPDPVERARALKIIALTGTLEERAALVDLVLDSADDIILRREVIANMDWSGLGYELAALLADERSADVRQSAITAAADAGFSPGERTAVDAAMAGLFENNDREPAVQADILDYFANSSAAPAYSLATLYSMHPSAEILERMNFITEFYGF